MLHLENLGDGQCFGCRPSNGLLCVFLLQSPGKGINAIGIEADFCGVGAYEPGSDGWDSWCRFVIAEVMAGDRHVSEAEQIRSDVRP
jgi:hypothetical protein